MNQLCVYLHHEVHKIETHFTLLTTFTRRMITTACLLRHPLIAVPLSLQREAPTGYHHDQPCRTEADTPLLVADERPGNPRRHWACHLERPLPAPRARPPHRGHGGHIPPRTDGARAPECAPRGGLCPPPPLTVAKDGPCAPAERLRLGSQRPRPPSRPPLTRCPAPVGWRPACWPALAS